jgi:hypothetical protein
VVCGVSSGGVWWERGGSRMLQLLGYRSQLPTNAVVHIFAGLCDRCADMLVLVGLSGSSLSAFMLSDSTAAADAGL